MRKGQPYLVALALLFGFSVAPLKTTSNPATAPAPKPSLSSVASPAPPADLEQFLCGYFYSKPSAHIDKGWCDIPPDIKQRYLIALVPNPEHANLASNFDTIIEAIQRSAAAGGYYHDRHHFPWKKLKPGAREPEKKDGVDKPDQQPKPGIILFRGHSLDGKETVPDRFLAVYLIAESPTSGVDREAFWQAFRAIHRRAPYTGRDEIRILGPTFSGTADSLYSILGEMKQTQGKADVRFISGTATVLRIKAELESQSREPDFKVSFSATLANDDRSLTALLDYFKRIDIPRSSIAVLSEAGTVFGESFRPKGTGKNVTEKEDLPLTIEFPYQISRLRNAYQSDPELRRLWEGQDTNALSPKEALFLPSSAATSDQDGVPLFSEELTPRSQERQIRGIASTLRRHDIRAAAINSTDILDTIFIARLLGRYAPDVRLFTLDSDLLFLGATPNLSLNGLLMVSNYPLWLDNQNWQRPLENSPLRDRFVPFSNRTAAAVYNAARLLLEDDPDSWRLIEYSHPWRPTPRPPLWLSVVGDQEVWPVALLDDPKEPCTDDASMYCLPKSLLQEPPHIHASLTFIWIFVVVSLIGAVALMNHYYHYGFSLRDPVQPPDRRSYPWIFEPPAKLEGWPSIFTQLYAWAGLAGYAPLLAVVYAWRSCRYESAGLEWILALCFFTGIIISLAATFTIGKEFVATILTQTISATWKALHALWSAVLAVALIWYFAFWFDATASEPNGPLFLVRCLFPTSGVSPLTPHLLVYVALCFWISMQLNRMRFHEIRWPGSVDFGQDGMLTGLKEALDRLACWAGQLMGFHLQFILTILFWSLFVLLVKVYPLGTSLEDRRWTLSFWVGFHLLALALTATLIRFVWGWLILDRTLLRVAGHHLASALSRVGEGVSVSEMWFERSTSVSWRTVALSLARLRRIPGCESQAVEIEKSYQSLLTSVAARKRPNADEVQKLHAQLNAVAAGFATDLTPVWRKGGIAPASAETIKEEFIASRFLAQVRYGVLQLRLLVEFLSIGVISLLLVSASYPFYPRGTLLLGVASFAVVTGLLVTWVFWRSDSHPVLKALNAKEEGKWNLDLFGKLMIYGAPPFLTLLATQFPGLSKSLGSLLEPIAKLFAG